MFYSKFVNDHWHHPAKLISPYKNFLFCCFLFFGLFFFFLYDWLFFQKLREHVEIHLINKDRSLDFLLKESAPINIGAEFFDRQERKRFGFLVPGKNNIFYIITSF